MKIYLFFILLLLFVKTVSSLENEAGTININIKKRISEFADMEKKDNAESDFFNFDDAYYIPDNCELEYLLPIRQHTNVTKRSDFRLNEGGFWKTIYKRLLINLCYYIIPYAIQTPYMFFDKKYVEWSSGKKGYNPFFPCDDNDNPCPDRTVQMLFFIYEPHCGDLAFCIKQSLNFLGNKRQQDSILKLLNASWKVQRLIRYEDQFLMKMCHGTTLKKEIRMLLNKINDEHFSRYWVQNYQRYFKDAFWNAIKYNVITLIKYWALFLLMTSGHTYSTFWNNSLYMVLCGSMAAGLIRLDSLVDIKVYGSIILIAIFAFAQYLARENNMHGIEKLPEFFSLYSIVSSIFYLIMLSYKYVNLKNVIHEFGIVQSNIIDSRAKNKLLLDSKVRYNKENR